MRSPVQSIRQHCLNCVGGSRLEVKLCTSIDCPLFPYRFGKNPNRKGIGGRGNPGVLRKFNLSLDKNAQN